MTELLTEDLVPPATTATIETAAVAERREALALRLERHRPALVAHCRRMLGSAFEADDAVQETMVRAWRSYDRFEGRASLKSWLHRIATNVCFDMMNAPQRRARPTDPTTWSGPGPVPAAGGMPAGAVAAVAGPLPVGNVAMDPADQAVGREDVRLAFVAALLHLPPRQRSVLLLCEVLKWQASEVAELLGTSVASVNSALQRARATLSVLRPAVEAEAPAPTGPPGPAGPVQPRTQDLDDDQRALLQRFTAAFDRYDISSLVALLR